MCKLQIGSTVVFESQHENWVKSQHLSQVKNIHRIIFKDQFIHYLETSVQNSRITWYNVRISKSSKLLIKKNLYCVLKKLNWWQNFSFRGFPDTIIEVIGNSSFKKVSSFLTKLALSDTCPRQRNHLTVKNWKTHRSPIT